MNSDNKTVEATNMISDDKLKKITNLLDESLQDKSEVFKKRVLDFVLSCNLDPNDPLLLLMVANGSLQATLEEAPKSLSICLENWIKELSKTLDIVENISILRQKTAVIAAARSLVTDILKELNIGDVENESKNRKQIADIIMPASLILVLTLTIGVLIGIIFPPWFRGFFGGGYSQVQGNQLTWDEVEAMKWGLSKEGKFAKNLINWNRDYLDNGQCLKDAQKLDLSFSENGKVAKSGYCVVWAAPPNKRKFKNK